MSGGVSYHMRMQTLLRAVPEGNRNPFKFFNHTTAHLKFLNEVFKVRNETEPLYHSQSALERFYTKLKSLKIMMRGPNKDCFGTCQDE